MTEILETESATFEKDVLNQPVPVLVDFWAPWCSQCKSMEPALNQLAAEYEGRAKVVKLNIDDEFELAQKFGVRSLPTFMLFNEGTMKTFSVGARSKAELEKIINNVL